MSLEKELFSLEQPHGAGDVHFTWQNGSGGYLATTGKDQTVAIYNRNGKLIERIRLRGICNALDWDADGDLLAMLAPETTNIILWDANMGRKHQVDAGLRDPLTCLIWAKKAPILAVGSAKGNLTIYNHATSKRLPLLGKHNKKITCGCWSEEGLLALGSEDKTLTINNIEGDTLRVINVRADPSDIQFSEMKLDERLGGENTVSVIIGRRTLFLYNLHDQDNPIELAFQQRYGALVAYRWFGDGYILLGFGSGFFVAISTHVREVGQELFQVKNHRDTLTSIAICTALGQVASCGDNLVKIHDMNNLQETVGVLTLEGEASVEQIGWSQDGQLLAASTRSGNIRIFLTRLTLLSASFGTQIALLSSLSEVTLYDTQYDKGKANIQTIETVVEPSFLALGPRHLVAGMNNRAWFYDLTQSAPGDGNVPLLLQPHVNFLGRYKFCSIFRGQSTQFSQRAITHFDRTLSDDKIPFILVEVSSSPLNNFREKEYLGTVTNMKINGEYASVLYEGKIQLHMLEAASADKANVEMKLFPESSAPDVTITCHALTNEFLIYATDMGHLCIFYVDDWKQVHEFRHSAGIRAVYPDISGTRMIIIDARSEAYVLNPVNDQLTKIPSFPQHSAGVLWNIWPLDRDVFLAYDNSLVAMYVYVPDSIEGTIVETAGKVRLPPNQVPLLFSGDEVQVQTAGGKLTQIQLAANSTKVEDVDNALKRHLLLRRFKEAWKLCQQLNKKSAWTSLAEAALRSLNIETAIHVYRHLRDVAMVWSLEEIREVEDQRLFSGHIAMFLKMFDKAQEWYLSSSEPKAALDMRRDLLQWEQALQLARNLDPREVPSISYEYAHQLEFTGHYMEALTHYERGLIEISALTPKLSEAELAHNMNCNAGIARTSIRGGDVRRGVAIALGNDSSRDLQRECAEILESLKHLNEAVSLYEKAECYEKAASCYIQLKKWSKVGELLSKISSAKIHLQYAKAKEADGQYAEAAKAYETAHDWDNAIRINLDHLNNPEKAVRLVQETKSVEGAKLVAKFFQQLNDYRSAIRFLVMSQCHEEAFQLASRHKQLELYGDILLEAREDVSAQYQASDNDYRSLALHFESEHKALLAGKYFYYAGEYSKAMKHLLKCAQNKVEENEAIGLAIETVASSKDDRFATQLIDFLIGNIDGSPRDPKYLFELYMALEKYREAAKTAIIVANEEQINGNYRNAHDVLLAMYQELRQRALRIPPEMEANLMLLHSYILVRLHVRRGDHLKSARMLVRVANNISRFPSHIVPIFTSAVIECHRTGLKTQAFTYAAILMRPEYRSQVDPKYQKKIEAVVRKPPRKGKMGEVDDVEEAVTPCPFCDAPLLETELNCANCKNTVPFCIATGRHIVKSDLTACPNCDFPAIYSELLPLVKAGESCPMCSKEISADQLIMIRDPKPYLYNEGDE